MKLTNTDKIILMEARLKEAIEQCRKARTGTLGNRPDHIEIAMRKIDEAKAIGEKAKAS